MIPAGVFGGVPAWLIALFGLVALIGPLFAWTNSLVVVGPARGPRVLRAGAPFLLVAALLVAAAAGLRLLGWASGAPGGPIGWVDAVNRALAQPVGFWGLVVRLTGLTVQVNVVPADLVYPLAALFGVASVPLTWGAALYERRRKDAPDYRVPFGGYGALVIAASAVGATVFLYDAYAVSGDRLLVDLVAAVPSTLVCLALWAVSGRQTPAEEAKAEDAPAVVGSDRGDIVGEWRRIGALAADARPVFVAVPVRGEGGSTEVSDAWRSVGAPGPAPQSLEQIAALLHQPGHAWVVGDLPEPSEVLFLAGMVLLAAQGRGIPSLVVTADPAGVRRRVADALGKAGAWRYGPLVAGEEELRLALEQHRMPAAAFLDLHALSSRGIRALWNCLTAPATAWTRTVGLVVVSRIDRGTPLECTHRFFALRRLALALAAGSARYSLLATGMGGTGTTHFVNRVFPTLRVADVPFGTRASAPVKVWLAQHGFVRRPGEPWPRRAARPLVDNLRLAVAVGDPGGLFDASVDIWGGDVRLTRDLTLDGAASVSQLDDAWLVAAWRTMGNRVPMEDGSTHHALWAWNDSPVTRFLVEEDNLRRFHAHGRLPTPRALVGQSNHHLAMAHLKAAMREGRQDVESLNGYFGRALVEQVLRATPGPSGHVLRRTPARDKLSRVATVPALSGSLDDVLRDTVTEEAVSIVDRNGGRVIGRCDREVAETRFYPGRVFASRDARYHVPQHSFDAQRRQIIVESVPPDHPLTRPRLDIRLSVRECVDLPQEVKAERRTYHLATYDVDATEEVSGIDLADGKEVRYASPVRVRYRTRVRALHFPRGASEQARRHLAACVDRVLLAHLLASDDDIHVIPIAERFHQELPAGVAAVDRYVGGMGVAETLDVQLVEGVLVWVRQILQGCTCDHGCPRCTPEDAIRFGPDKVGVLRMLGA